MTKEKIVHGPCGLNQRMLLMDNTTDVIFTGGSAGG